VLPGIYLRRKIAVTNGKELSSYISKKCAAYFNGVLKKVEKK
jgi:hypothetical protein